MTQTILNLLLVAFAVTVFATFFVSDTRLSKR